MVPVDQGVIKTDMEPFCTERIHIFADQVFAAEGVGGLVIGIFAVKKAEALVMFCCHDDIFHACRFCLSCPFLRVVQIRIKVFKIEIVVIFRDFFVIFDPFVTRGHGV